MMIQAGIMMEDDVDSRRRGFLRERESCGWKGSVGEMGAELRWGALAGQICEYFSPLNS